METLYLSNAEKRERLNRLDSETYMRWAYVPFVVAEGAWDYADTVINISAQMKLTETKKLCRAIRELRRSYIGIRKKYAMTSSGYELENFQVLEDTFKKNFAHMYRCISDAIQKQYPELASEYRQLLMATYACIAILEALSAYADLMQARVREICEFGSMSSILPEEVHALRRLMPEFVGDKPLKIKGMGLFKHNFVRSLCAIRLTNDKTVAGIK